MKRREADLSEGVIALLSFQMSSFSLIFGPVLNLLFASFVLTFLLLSPLPFPAPLILLLSFGLPLFFLFFLPLWEMSFLSFQFILTTYSPACQRRKLHCAYMLTYVLIVLICVYFHCHPWLRLLPTPTHSRRHGSNGPEPNNGRLLGGAESFICLKPGHLPLVFHLTHQP